MAFAHLYGMIFITIAMAFFIESVSENPAQIFSICIVQWNKEIREPSVFGFKIPAKLDYFI